MMTGAPNIKTHPDAGPETSTTTMYKWGGFASFLLAAAFILAPLIYLTGNLRSAIGPLAYSLADFLYGPAWAASLIAAILALRERIGERFSRRMSLALLAAALAAGAMVLVACIRAANRQYHLIHPELHLENSIPVLVVWSTIVAGITGAGWHFLGWMLALVGWAGWTSGRLPRGLCALYLVAAVASLFVYALPNMEGAAGALGVIWAVWQGMLLWKTKPGERQAAEKTSLA